MYANRLIDFLRNLFGMRRRPALQPVRVRLLLGVALIPAALMVTQTAMAGVLATGNYSPRDNIFTPLPNNEGIPLDGNFVNPDELPQTVPAPPPARPWQTYYEGRHVDGITDDLDSNINFDILVGITSSGALLISDEAALRDQDLIIGSSGTVGSGQAAQTRFGTGVVRVTGFGSVYNNDPLILSADVQGAIDAGLTFHSVNPRPDDIGFDLVVGYTGTGTLEITAGGRAEIQDDIAVGDSPGANGTVVVDGIDSFLGNNPSIAPPSGGGGAPVGTNATGGRVTRHSTVIGRLGTGALTISTGGTVASQVAAAASGGSGTATQGAVAAVLGSAPYTEQGGFGPGDSQGPPAGGSGTATVTGVGSKWLVGGTLQIGGFDLGSDGIADANGDDEGESVQYGTQAGRGNLYVNDGGLVNIRDTAASQAPGGGTDQATLSLVVGRFGVVQLNGGTILVGGPTGSESGGGQGPSGTPSSVQLINDGVIRGNGRITTGVFRNRYLGQIRVDGGQSLVIDSTADLGDTTDPTATPVDPLVNFGTIQVIGNSQAQAQLEFVRLRPLVVIRLILVFRQVRF